MVFMPSRQTAPVEQQSDDSAICLGAQAIIDLLDIVDSVYDVEHLQSVAFLAQEFGLLTAPTFLFASRGPEPRRPHSLLLESHFYALLCEKVIDRDGSGRLRPRRDLYDLPHSSRVARRLGILTGLTPRDTAVFAAAVLGLINDGRHAGSQKHDAAFDDAVALTASMSEDEHEAVVDTAAIHAARQRLMPAAPVLLTTASASRQLSAVSS